MFKCAAILCFLSSIAFAADPKSLTSVPKEAVPTPFTVFNFDRDKLMVPPQQFMVVSSGDNPEIRWEVQKDIRAPSKPQILVQIGKANPGENFALLVREGTRLDHGEVVVRFKVLAGEEDQSAGIVFRYQDAQNYDVIRASVRDDNCVYYRVKKGKRKPIDTKDAIVTPYTWHELRVTFTPDTYTALLNGELVLGGRYTGAPGPGLVGLWTKSDSQIAFDDFRVSK